MGTYEESLRNIRFDNVVRERYIKLLYEQKKEIRLKGVSSFELICII